MIIHFLDIDNIKISGENDKELRTLDWKMSDVSHDKKKKRNNRKNGTA